MGECWWRSFVAAGRVQWEPRSSSPEAVRTVAGERGWERHFKLVSSGNEIVSAGERVMSNGHVHERCVRAALPRILAGTDRFLVVEKPHGVPCQSNRRGVLNVEGLLATMGYAGLHLAHRLDQPVSGVLVL